MNAHKAAMRSPGFLGNIIGWESFTTHTGPKVESLLGFRIATKTIITLNDNVKNIARVVPSTSEWK